MELPRLVGRVGAQLVGQVTAVGLEHAQRPGDLPEVGEGAHQQPVCGLGRAVELDRLGRQVAGLEGLTQLEVGPGGVAEQLVPDLAQVARLGPGPLAVAVVGLEVPGVEIVCRVSELHDLLVPAGPAVEVGRLGLPPERQGVHPGVDQHEAVGTP
jgi:hypothetical protein